MNEVVKTSIATAVGLVLSLCSIQARAEERASWRILAPSSIRAGGAGELKVIFDIDDPWYIYAPTGAAAALGMVETNILLTAPNGITLGKAQFPKHVNKGPYQVFQGNGVTVIRPIRVARVVPPGSYKIRGKIIYQICKPDLCLPPQRDDAVVWITVK